MLKTLKNRWPLVALVGLSALSVGAAATLLKGTDAFSPPSPADPVLSTRALESSEVLGLTGQSVAARQMALESIAEKGRGVERDRARYLLAADYLSQGKAGSALPLLEGLEESYQVLVPYVLLKRGQAQMQTGDTPAAIATWQQLAQTYGQSPAAAEALFLVGQLGQPSGDLTAWTQLLQSHPSHPRSVEVAYQQAAATATSATQPPTAPSAPAPSVGMSEVELLKLVAYHGQYYPNYTEALDRLTSKHSAALMPEDWAAIGFGYWDNQVYGKAGDAYAKAPPSTPRTLYRAARGKERGGKGKEAIALYLKLNEIFPTASETATGLLNMAQLQNDQASLKTLDQVIERFPEYAAEALVNRADVLEDLESPGSAKQARASILSQYPESDAAADIRLKQAKANAKKGDYSAAISWGQKLVSESPDAEAAAEGGFLLGRWLLRQNQPDAARKAFEQVIRNHPESYFSWRSAIYLDWDVGNFDTVRQFKPTVAVPARRRPLPAGSAELQELYLLRQDQDVWTHWQSEFVNRQLPSVSEQFTDGLTRLGIGDNLDGIFMVSSLAWREEPAEIAEHELLKENPAYWQAIYPLPYANLILPWSEERSLNPLLVTALMRQESRFQANIKSRVGAIGLMQVMPETGAWISQQIGASGYNLEVPEDNVKFGTWYLDFTHSQFSDNSLFAVASYNAGPGAVSDWIKKGDFANADEFVDKIPYPETKGYISSVFGGYWNYLRLYDPEIAAKVEKL